MALRAYGQVMNGIVEDMTKKGAKGYELFAIWLNSVYDLAQHTGQLE